MSKLNPISGFKWMDPKEFDFCSKGCVLEADLEYPKELQELHNNYSLAPDKIKIKREILSDYQLKIAELHNVPIGNAKKFVPNFFEKGKYVLHFQNLQLYIRLGLKLKSIHHVLEFHQSEWLKPCIEFNTKKV